ncbi:hypothetical protein G9C85_08175 [Halorubellus sp. JP-L1]|uniref:DUF7511 domain-containing protein n=1 Tax=Halorubellus sp. JP-L1 TaxID=2715753 RepID=UPI001408DC9C|nr:hypothetical protein [Halorubellus sp. JP-L1]NHN41611.1 hypothetical protein [Halorubellus sp. JP-L1]
MPASNPNADPSTELEHDDAHASTTDSTTDDPGLVTLHEDTIDGRRCTICPAPARAHATDLVTNWLTIDANAVVDLDDWR